MPRQSDIGRKEYLQQMVSRQLGIYMQKHEIGPDPTYTKIKVVQRFKCKVSKSIIKSLGKKYRLKSLWSWISQQLLRYNTKAQATKRKIDDLDLTKI